jgi:hypothetical protein
MHPHILPQQARAHTCSLHKSAALSLRRQAVPQSQHHLSSMHEGSSHGTCTMHATAALRMHAMLSAGRSTLSVRHKPAGWPRHRMHADAGAGHEEHVGASPGSVPAAARRSYGDSWTPHRRAGKRSVRFFVLRCGMLASSAASCHPWRACNLCGTVCCLVVCMPSKRRDGAFLCRQRFAGEDAAQ